MNLPLHVLINNAGILVPEGERGTKTEDGFEVGPMAAAFVFWIFLGAGYCNRHILLASSISSNLLTHAFI